MKNLKHIELIKELCKKYGVESLYVFGSVLTNQFKPDSDIDFLVDFIKSDSKGYANNYFEFKFSLEEILGREVDLLEQKAIKNPYFLSSINKQKQQIYG